MAEKKKKLTPMMKQYFEMKEANPGVLLLYRLGDFYEMFFEDAKIASQVLGLTLTKRNHGGEGDTPLAGFPHHALDRYAHKLVKAGYRIAICEQVEDPKKAKGVVKRDIVEIISAGTGMDDNYINENANNFIAVIYPEDDQCGVAVCDISTGEFFGIYTDIKTVEEELTRIDPSEIILPEDIRGTAIHDEIETFFQGAFSFLPQWKFKIDACSLALHEHFDVRSLQGLGLEGKEATAIACGSLLTYLKEQKRSDLSHIVSLRIDTFGSNALLDPASIRNLELLKPIHTDESGGTLVSVLDKTVTSLGSRMMKRWIVRPLTDIGAINQRLDSVEWFSKELFLRADLETLLKCISDLERGIAKVTLGRANGRDLVAIGNSLRQFPEIDRLLSKTPSFLIKNLLRTLEGFEELEEMIDASLVEEPPLSLREGGIIRDGVNPDLDEYREAIRSGKQWIAQLQQSEREKTGIDSMKIGYNKVFGYYLEVSKIHMEKVPDYFMRKQTLANSERYITPELKDIESKVLGAEEKINDLEYDLFVKLRNRVSHYTEQIQRAAESVAILDVLSALGRIASENQYNRPTLKDSGNLKIIEGRHPVVEKMIKDEAFVPNDTEFIENEKQLYIITGPNMAGKSTYLRQNALIALMAQIGSFVPAEEAEIGIVDRFFTRIGASDRLARGQSTFLVEMIEVANILNNATDRSLVLLDEVGRGTSTFDGVSIAWAVAEYLHNTKGKRARTLFATHYHELTELESLLDRVANLHIKVKEYDGKIIFLRKIVEGGCSHSYGIQVAGLAGIPSSVIERSKEILSNLEGLEYTAEHKPAIAKRKFDDTNSYVAVEEERAEVQLNLFDAGTEHKAVSRLREVNVFKLNPLEALNLVAELKEML